MFGWPNRSVKVWGLSKRKDFESGKCFPSVFTNKIRDIQSIEALAYCFVHSSMHMLRVLLLTVAINTSSTLGGRFRSWGVYEQPTLIGSICINFSHRKQMDADLVQRHVECRSGKHSQQGTSRCETDWTTRSHVVAWVSLEASREHPVFGSYLPLCAAWRSAVFLIIVTNNFGEIKSTVFKRYEAQLPIKAF